VGHGAAEAPSGASIAWESWGIGAFERARAENRMVLVDVGIEGCTACRWMFEDTYRDPEVVARVNEHFVAVSVDANVRPDLGDRYARWGWPATIVLSPEGTQVLAIRGNKRPRNFIPILDELVDRHLRGALEAEASDPIPEPVDDSALAAVCGDVEGRLSSLRDTEHGGYGQLKGIGLAPVEHAFLRAHLTGDATLREHALRTLEGWTRLVDPVWGGVFVAARRPDWTQPIPEKRTVHQAAALFGFAEAFMVTGDAGWLAHAQDVHRYLSSVMQHADGSWYATQEDLAPGLPRGMSAADYYELGDDERRRYGMPPVDHGIYTDLNGMVIRGYAHLFEATGDDAWRVEATTAADALLAARQDSAGWMRQSTHHETLGTDDRMRVFEADACGRVYLKAQPYFGLALVELYRVTGEERYREAAIRIADAMIAELADADVGGFFATTRGDTDALVPRDKPFYDNLAAVRFLLALHVDSHDDAHRAAADEALLFVAQPSAVRRRGPRVADLALAIEELSLGPVELSVVTRDRELAEARALFAAGRGVYEPRKALHYEMPGRYPDLGRPAVFVCSNDACSSPVYEPEGIAAAAARFAEAETSRGCAASRVEDQ
jgi:uncharacterized protein YyaL (SSP411 family)